MEKVSQLGHYRIDSELAHSNICTVYRGFEASLGRPVLIKKLHPQMAREDDIRNRFEREAQACAQVKHENIVDIYGYYAEPDQTMLVLEFVDGPSLAELVAAGEHIPWKPALAILHGVLKGLAYAHSKSVIHRDIKPDNILISKQGKVKISDFGLATLEDAPKLTRQGMVVGTPAYMPPEQITGSTIDQRSDIFSLGATFYELLTGTSPFFADNFSEIMKKVLHANLQKPSAVIPDIPTEFDQIILRMIEKQPTKRYASAEQALLDVRRLAEQYAVPLHTEAVREFLSSTLPADSAWKRKSTTLPIPAPIKRRKSVWRYVAAGAALIAVVLIVYGISSQKRPPEMLPPSVEKVTGNETAAEKVVSQPPESEVRTIAQDRTSENERRANTQTETTEPETQVARIDPRIKTPPVQKPLTDINNIRNTQSPAQQSGNKAIQQQPGWLNISTRPWATVIIDNETIGNTPLTSAVELSPGEHQLVLVNDQFPTPVVESISIEPGSEKKISIDLWSYFAVINIRSVKPWAEIFIDKVLYGETPLAKPIILPPGRHEIELRNPDCQTWRKTVNINRGDPPEEISVVLEPLESIDLNP